MPLLASEVMDEAAKVYLNDSTRVRWPDAVLLPYLRSSIEEMQQELLSNDLPPLYEISADISLTTGNYVLDLPPDFVFPVSLSERAPGEEPKNATGMDEVTWEPTISPEEKIKYWAFREGRIYTPGALSERIVRMKYLRSLTTIVSENSVIEVPNAKGFYSARTAGLASQFGGAASARGTSANERAEYFKRLVINSITSRLQDRPVRRKRYRVGR